MSNAEFIKYVILACAKHKIRIEFSPEKSDCVGYFEHNPKEIYIYTNCNEYNLVTTLLHEYCHSLQFTEDFPLYWEVSKYAVLDDSKNWAKYNKHDMKHILGKMRDLELDCEQRALGLIDELDLDIDAAQYAREASAGLYHYNFIIQYGWETPNLLNYPDIVDKMPTNLKRTYKQTPAWLKKSYLKHIGG